jgi:4-hydroxybenzoate polyprenyltransferase
LSFDYFFEKDSGFQNALEFLFKWLIPGIFLGLSYCIFRFQFFHLANITITLLFFLFYLMIRFLKVVSFDEAGIFLLAFLFVIVYTILSIKHLRALKSKMESSNNE